MLAKLLIWFNEKFDRFTASAPISQEEKTRLQHYMIFMFLGIPTMLSFGVINLIQRQFLVSIFAFSTVVGLIFGLFLLKNMRNGEWIYRCNALLYLCLICYMIAIGGEDGSKLLWSYTLPLICCFLLGTREGGIWSSFVVVFAFFSFNHPEAFVNDGYAYSSSFKIRFLITYIFCSIISMWLESSRHFFLDKSKAVSAELVKEHTKLKEEIEFRKSLEQELKRIARIDPLTGILNRGAFFLAAEKEWNKHVRNSKTMSFAVLDIDHFKIINDKYGHPAGDQMLINVVHSCVNSIRGFDIFGRIGGEEFAMLFTETDLAEAKMVLERLRENVENTIVEYEGEKLRCTISIGLYCVIPPSDVISGIFKKADLALYQAKVSGRNKVCVYSSDD